ncbi:unnamed protein product, partial [Urochloa humidicola]
SPRPPPTRAAASISPRCRRCPRPPFPAAAVSPQPPPPFPRAAAGWEPPSIPPSRGSTGVPRRRATIWVRVAAHRRRATIWVLRCGASATPSDSFSTKRDPAKDVLKDALQDQMVMCQHIRGTFDTAVADFRGNKPEDMDIDLNKK